MIEGSFYNDKKGFQKEHRMQSKTEQQMKNTTGNATDFPLYLYHHGKNDRIYDLFPTRRSSDLYLSLGISTVGTKA